MSSIILKSSFLMLEDGLKKDWGVRIVDNRIEEVAPIDQLISKPDDEVIEFPGKILAPGFVNGHMHMYGVLSHGITSEALVTEFSSFLEDFWWPYVENRVDHDLTRITTKWSCVELIKSGITSFMDVLEAPNALPGALEIEAQEVKNAGLRAILSFEACERNSEENGLLGLQENADFIKKNNPENGTVKGMMCIHTLFTASKDFIVKAKEMAKQLNCDIHMHLSESDFEPNWCKEQIGKRPVDIYDELGYLDNRVFASQVVRVDENELEILANRNVRVVSMPLSNCEVGGGFAPVPDMLALNMNVGLGTDGYINNFFEVMRGAFLLHKANRRNPQVMPAKKVYQMATSLGAQAMGITDTGKVEKGCLADLITIDADTPTPINEFNVYDQLILFRNPEYIHDVMVDGKFIMRNRELLTVNESEIKEEMREKTEQFWRGN